MCSHREACEENHQSARGWEKRHEPSLEADVFERTAREHGYEPDARDRQRKPGTERADEQHPEDDAVERDRRQKNDERRRAWQQPAGDADRNERAAAQIVIVTMPMIMAGGVRT